MDTTVRVTEMRRRSKIGISVGFVILIAMLAGFFLIGKSGTYFGKHQRPAENDWPGHDGGDGTSYSLLDQITPATINKLGLAWSLDLPGERSLEATPLAIDGTLYFTGSQSVVYAVDGISGHLLWKYDPEIWKHMPNHMHYHFGANRGAAFWDGKVYEGTMDGRLIALDAKTGKLVWSAVTVSASSKKNITGAPAVLDGKILIGNAGADYGERGYVTAYDAETGQQVWRFYIAPGSPQENAGDPVMEMAAKTWAGKYWKTGTGGSVWSAMTYDAELNRVYIGTGNSGPYDPRVRSPGNGDNLFLTSIVALDADTGKYIWHYQYNPREAWDFKASNSIVPATINFEGKPRKVLMQSPTNGFYYILDRETGKLLSAEKLGKVTWAKRIDLRTGRPVEEPNIRYENGPVTFWPSPAGIMNWQTMSYSPKTGLAYIPAHQLGMTYSDASTSAGARVASIKSSTLDPQDGKGWLLAWDPVRQRPRWKVEYASGWNGGTMVTAGNVVFNGTGDGLFAGYNATNGKLLWSFDAKLGIIAAPITFTAGGRQYVSILVGYGGGSAVSDQFNRGWKFGQQPRRLLTFALDGHASLPFTPPRDMVVHAVDDPALKIDDARAAKGAITYIQSGCVMCHGIDLKSHGTNGPDLRESGVPLDRAAFGSLLSSGSMASLGMPRFETLTEDDIGDLYFFIRARSREALGLRKPSQVASGPILH